MNNTNDFIIENGVLIQYVGPGGDVVIPNGTIAIDKYAFMGKCGQLTRLVIPEGVVEIAERTFERCFELESLVLPESLEVIGYEAFGLCWKLKDFILPKNIRAIKGYAFYEGKSLKTLSVPNPDCEIDVYAFHQSGLEELTMPWKKGKSLSECPNLRIIRITTHLEESWTRVNTRGETYTQGPATFNLSKKSAKLEKVYAPLCDISRMGNAKTEAVLGFAELAAQDYSFEEKYAAQYEAYIRKQKKKLYPIAFNDPHLLAYMLQKKIIPLADIAMCIELAEKQGQAQATAALLDYQNANFDEKDRSSQEKKVLAKELHVPTQTEVLKNAYTTKKGDDGTLIITMYKGTAQEIVIPEQIGKAMVSEIEGRAFSPGQSRLTAEQIAARKNIKSVVIGKHVRRIGWAAFAGCENLEQVCIQGEDASIESGAFSNCPKLVDDDGFVIVHGVLFAYYGHAEQVVVPNSVKVIGCSAFIDNQAIKEIQLPEQLEQIEACAFMNCKNIEQITIPQNVNSLMDNAFIGCKKLKKVYILSPKTSICRCNSTKQAPKVTYCAPAGSFAEKYATCYKIPFVAE